MSYGYDDSMAFEGRPIPSTSISNSEFSVGAGWIYLQQQLNDKAFSLTDTYEKDVDNPLSPTAKRILQGLLEEHDVKLPSVTEQNAEEYSTAGSKRFKPNKMVEKTMSDETILELARTGQVCLLASLLKVIDEHSRGKNPHGVTSSASTGVDEGVGVSTRHLLKTCCLAVYPPWTPACMDAKEMVLAALVFLSQYWNEGSTANGNGELNVFTSAIAELPPLPLIRAVQLHPLDLEKCSYEKHGHWKLSVIMSQVRNLELLFYSSAAAIHTDSGTTSQSNKWLSRERFCPQGFKLGRDLLLLKGTPPAAILGKSQKKSTSGSAGSSGRGRKSATPKDSSTSSQAPTTFPTILQSPSQSNKEDNEEEEEEENDDEDEDEDEDEEPVAGPITAGLEW